MPAVGKWARTGVLTPAVITPGGRYRWRWSEVEREMHERQLRERELRERQLREKRQRDE